MTMKTSFGFILIYIFCTSFLFSSDTTQTTLESNLSKNDTTSAKIDTTLIESVNNKDNPSGLLSKIKLQYIIGICGLILAFVGLLISWRSRKTQKQMAIFQESDIKLKLLPKIQEILNVLDDIAHIHWGSFEKQLEANSENFKKLKQLNIYLSESDEMDKKFGTLHDIVYEISGKIGEISSIMVTPFKDTDNDRIKSLRTEITNTAKNLHNEIFEIQKSINKKYRIKIKD